VVREGGWGQGGEMTQALYAHMNKKKEKRNRQKKKNLCIKKKKKEKANVLIFMKSLTNPRSLVFF
jgi:hypothetical protein